MSCWNRGSAYGASFAGEFLGAAVMVCSCGLLHFFCCFLPLMCCWSRPCAFSFVSLMLGCARTATTWFCGFLVAFSAVFFLFV